MVARAIVDTRSNRLPCRVLNPTEKPIKLKSCVAVGILTPVTVHPTSQIKQQSKRKATMAQMLKALTDKKVTLEGVTMTGADFEELVTLLYENLDLFATSLMDLPGTFLHDHVRTCLTCQMIKAPSHPIKNPIGALPNVPPGERWIVDFHGAFPASGPDDKRYVLAFIDSASLWPEMAAVKKTSAETVVQALFNCIISRWGFPKQIDLRSDNGSGFIAKLTDLCCRTFGITQYFSTPFRPQPQAKVESHAKVIHQKLKVLCNKQQDWS